MVRNVSGNWVRQYNLSDHLGNTRAVLEPNGSVLQQTDYYPFGAAFAVANTTKNKYLYGGKELQDEVIGGALLGLYDFEARFLDTRLSVFTTPDPLREKYYNVSPYAYCNNNPIMNIDPIGMNWYIFDANTMKYAGMQEMDGTHRMAIRSEDEEGNITYNFYDFNDPEVDAKSIENGEIDRMEFLSDDTVETMISNSGVRTDEARSSKWSSALKNYNGHMDYGHSSSLYKNTFYIRENVAYNVGDIGNYLWGRGMAELGFDLGTAKLGAHIHNMFNGRRQMSNKYNFGSGTYGSSGFWDSEGDQRAIANGYPSSPRGKRRIEENRIRNLKARKRYESGGYKFSMSIL